MPDQSGTSSVDTVYINMYIQWVLCNSLSLPPSAGGKLLLQDTVVKAGRESFFLGLSFIYSFLNRCADDGGHLKGVEAAQSPGS